MKIRPSLVMFLGVVTLLMICPQAFAHNLWLNPGDYYPQVGATVDIGIGWGHKYLANRVDQEIKEGRIEEIRAVGPDGLTVSLVQESVSSYKLKVEKPGVYLVTAKIKPGFFTTTPEGRKWGDKKAVTNPVTCTNFHIQAKTVIIAGGSDKNLSNAAGQPLEVIPLANPRNLKSGDRLTVKVLFQGKPLPKTSVKATYAGYEDGQSDMHAPSEKRHPAGGKHFPVETVTDDQGQATFSLDRAGYWMIALSHRSPYPDKDTCDEYMYNMTYTFEVK